MLTVIKLPEGVEARIEDDILFIKGPLGENKRLVKNPLFTVSLDEVKSVVIKSAKDSNSRKYKRIINTYASHINNMIKGVVNGYEARLKITYSHFPITVKVEGNNVIIDNFIGEKKPRKTKLINGAKLKVEGNIITITGLDKEVVGQTAANLERTTQIKKKDRRVFQDGIWIIKKP